MVVAAESVAPRRSRLDIFDIAFPPSFGIVPKSYWIQSHLASHAELRSFRWAAEQRGGLRDGALLEITKHDGVTEVLRQPVDFLVERRV
jgi:hypothetical protein